MLPRGFDFEEALFFFIWFPVSEAKVNSDEKRCDTQLGSAISLHFDFGFNCKVAGASSLLKLPLFKRLHVYIYMT